MSLLMERLGNIRFIDEPGSELSCQVITEADDDNNNKTDGDYGQNVISTCLSHQVANLCTTQP